MSATASPRGSRSMNASAPSPRPTTCHPPSTMRGLCIASLELIGDQAKRLTGWVGDQQFHVPEFGVMQPRRRRPPAQPG